MSANEFIEEWNKLFQYKVNEKTLQRPTDEFLFNALISYLKNINIDIDAVVNKYTDERKFKIAICQYVDRLYKMSDESYTFYYYDFIRPLPKKTLHLLNTLLNFYLFHKMMKQEVVDEANAIIKGYNDMVNKKVLLLQDDEKNRCQAKNIEIKRQALCKELPELKVKEKKIITEQQMQQTQILKAEQTIKHLDDKIFNYKVEKEDLKSKIVPEDEVSQMKESINTATNTLNEFNNTKKSAETIIKEYEEKITLLKANIDKIDLVTERNQTVLDELKALNDLLKENAKVNDEINDMTAYKKTLADKIDTIEKSLKEQNLCLSKISESFSELTQLKEALDKQLKHSEQLDNNLNIVQKELTELSFIYDTIVNSGNYVEKEISKF